MSANPVGHGHSDVTAAYLLDQLRRHALQNKSGKTASNSYTPLYGVDAIDAVTVADTASIIETGAVGAFEVTDDSADQPLMLELDRGILDGSGNKNNGTVTGVEQYVSGPRIDSSKGNAAFDFDGSTQIDISNESDFDRTHIQAFSISFWARWTAASTMVLISKMSAIANAGIVITAESDGKIRIRIINTATSDEIDVITTDTYNDGYWRHFCITKSTSSSASGVTLYVYGVDTTLNVTTDNLSTTPANNIEVTVGAYNGGTAYFTGQIFDVQWWNLELSSANAIDMADGKQISKNGSVTVPAFLSYSGVGA